jgi:hypothetical protein
MERWRGQSEITIVTPVKPEAMSALGELLGAMARDVLGNDVLPFGRLTNTHFARFFLLDSAQAHDGIQLPAYLIFMSDIDGRPEEGLAELVDVGGNGIDHLYRHCIGYPTALPASRQARLEYLRAHIVRADVNYVNTIGRTVQQIRGEAEVREAIEDFLDRGGPELVGGNPSAVRAAIREFVTSDGRLNWALTPAPAPPLAYRVRELVHFVVPVILGLLLLPVLVAVLLVWLVVLRLHEIRDPSPLVKPDRAHLDQLRALEDYTVQNQFIAAGFLKSGWFRRVTAVVILWLVGFGARHLFNNGNLAGVKTIHFARWILLDGSVRSVFVSNYDGSTESYMDDFIDKVAWALNAVFSHGAGYPATHWLLFGGARDEQAFKGFLRTHQLPTQVWYAAYDQLSALNIVDNARIRAGLNGDMTELETQKWLRLL